MAEEKMVHEQVQDLLASWNAPPTAHFMDLVIGAPVPEGDGRATASVRPEEMNHPRNSANSKTDAERMFTDDGEEEDETEDDGLDDMNIRDLRAEVDKRNEDLDEEDHLSKGGSAEEIRERIREFDALDDEDDDEDDESEEDDDDE